MPKHLKTNKVISDFYVNILGKRFLVNQMPDASSVITYGNTSIYLIIE